MSLRVSARKTEGLAQVRRALSGLRGADTVEDVLERATALLCLTCGFDRAMLSFVEEARLVVRSASVPREPAFAASVVEFARSNQPRLDEVLIATEMVRRQTAILVADPTAEPRAHPGFIAFVSTPGYVAAPIALAGEVVGFLHADLYYGSRAPDRLDRDRLWAFAEGFGCAFERALLLERLRQTMHDIRGSLDGADALMSHSAHRDPYEHLRVVRPSVNGHARFGGTRLARLTSREHEVLALVAEGLTNDQIADRLIVAAATIKTHVSSILRKLGAANRAEAVAQYLRVA